MFIEPSTTKTMRRSEGLGGLWAINITPLRGGKLCHVTWLFHVKGSKNLRKKQEVMVLYYRELSLFRKIRKELV